MAVGLGKDDHLARQVDISQVAAGEVEGLLLFARWLSYVPL